MSRTTASFVARRPLMNKKKEKGTGASDISGCPPFRDRFEMNLNKNLTSGG